MNILKDHYSVVLEDDKLVVKAKEETPGGGKKYQRKKDCKMKPVERMRMTYPRRKLTLE